MFSLDGRVAIVTGGRGLYGASISLGTVQIGMAYGRGEAREKMSEEKAFSILDTAMENGVDNLDTANNYGDSETVIGRWLDSRYDGVRPQRISAGTLVPYARGSRSPH